jgi:hypothetical protein
VTRDKTPRDIEVGQRPFGGEQGGGNGHGEAPGNAAKMLILHAIEVNPGWLPGLRGRPFVVSTTPS